MAGAATANAAVSAAIGRSAHWSAESAEAMVMTLHAGPSCDPGSACGDRRARETGCVVDGPLAEWLRYSVGTCGVDWDDNDRSAIVGSHAHGVLRQSATSPAGRPGERANQGANSFRYSSTQVYPLGARLDASEPSAGLVPREFSHVFGIPSWSESGGAGSLA